MARTRLIIAVVEQYRAESNETFNTKMLQRSKNTIDAVIINQR